MDPAIPLLYDALEHDEFRRFLSVRKRPENFPECVASLETLSSYRDDDDAHLI